MGVALVLGWGLTKLLTSIRASGSIRLQWFMSRKLSASSTDAFHLTQTSIAMLAIASLMFIVTLQHRREAHLFTQTQEEMLLIAGFGLFWVGKY